MQDSPSAQLKAALIRHADYCAGRAGGERLQRRGEDLSKLRLDEVKLDDAVLPGCRFVRGSLWRAELRRADLFGADFSYCNLSAAIFDRADLRATNFMMSKLRGASMIKADLRAGHTNRQ